MVYIRAKKVKSDQYLYLVKSVWDSKRNTSKQEIVKYLGKASDVVKEDIPIDYRNDPKVLAVLASFNPEDIKKREDASSKSKQLLYKRLTEGNVMECVKIYEQYTEVFSTADFFDRILKPNMQRIGDEWADGKLEVATEHVASNVAQSLIKMIMQKNSTVQNKKKLLLCVPIGEEHHIGCDVLETYLSIKGFKVFNMGTSIPTESILSFIDNHKPDIIMVSITLEDNLLAGQRLVKKISNHCNIPIFVGGLATTSDSLPKFDAEIIKDCGLEELPKILKKHN